MRFDLEQYRHQESTAGRATRPSAEKRIRTEAPHSAKAPSVRKKELLFFAALWRNSAWIGVLGGSQNPSVTGALEPVQKPDSFGIAVKALAKFRVRSPELSR